MATHKSEVELGSRVIWDHRPQSGQAGWQVRDAAGRGPPSMLGRPGPIAVLAGSLEIPTQAADGRVAQLPGSAPCPASMVAAASFGWSLWRPWGAAPSTCWMAADGLISVVQTFKACRFAWLLISQGTRSGLRSQSPAPAPRASQPPFPLKVGGSGWGNEFMLAKALACAWPVSSSP